MYTDPIADLLTRIRNGQTAGHPAVNMPASKSKQRLLSVLQEEGYIEHVDYMKGENNKHSLKVYLRYDQYGSPVIKKIQRMSRTGRRWYVGSEEIPACKSGLGTIVVSTSRGMMTGKKAKKLNVGGELICSIF